MRQMRSSDSHYDFVGRWKRWFVVSGIIFVVSIGSLFLRGINAGVEFRGGTQFNIKASSTHASVPAVRGALEKIGVTEPTVQQLGSQGYLIETKHLSASQQGKALNALSSLLKVKEADVNVTDVGPKWGAQITSKAVRALIIFIVVVILYLTIRLELRMAAAGMIALLHDVVITIGVYSLLGFEVTPSTVIALLTILGYSLYDTVVIFDRVKDRTAQLSAAGRVTYSQAANEALNHVLIRSLNTSMTALLPVGSLLFVGSFLLGAQTLRELALALFIGIAAGTYSSIFVATPALALMKEREPRWATLRARVAARGQDTTAPPPRSAAVSETAAAPVATAVMDTPAQPQQPTAKGTGGNLSQKQRPKGQPPRRKKKKKRR